MNAGIIASHMSLAATDYDAMVMADSPLAFWKMDETATAVVLDSSGNGRNGSNYNGVSYGQPSLLGSGVGKSYSYDGIDDVTQITSGSPYLDVTSLTVEFRYQYVNADSAFVISRWHSPSFRVFYVHIDNTGVSFTHSLGGTVYTTKGVFTFTAGVTHTIAVVRDSVAGKSIVYIDGVAIQTDTMAGNLLTVGAIGQLEFGRAAESNTLCSTMKLSRVSYHGTALSAARIAARHAAAIAA